MNHLMHRTADLMLGALVGVVAYLALGPATAALADMPLKDPLADDSRLARKVQVTVEGLAVSDLLAQLSTKTGVALTADPETGDDKVIVFSPARPLRDLLSDLAALFNDRWERKQAASGVVRYRLIRTVSARHLETTFARRTTEQMMARLERVVSGLDRKPEELESPENREIQWYVTDRKRRFALMLYRLLNRAQREALYHSESLRIAFRTLTPAQQAPVRAVFTDIIAEEKAFSEEKAKQLPPELGLSPPLVSQPEDLENGEIRFRLRHSGGGVVGELQFGKRHGSGILFAGFSTGNQWSLPAHGNPYSAEAVPADVPLPATQAIRRAAADKEWPDRVRRLSEGSGLSILADYYRVRPVTTFYIPLRRGAPDDGASALDDFCGKSGYLWWVKGKSLLLRKRDWFNQRPYEVPDRWLLDVVQRAQHRPLACADVLRVVDLTDEQILGLTLLSDRELGEDGQYSIFNRAEQIGGLREYLAIVNASPRKANSRIENATTLSSDGTTGEGFAVKHETMSLLQRRLVPVFLAAQDYPVSRAEPDQFSLFLYRSGMMPKTTVSGFKYVPFRLAWDLGGTEKISLGYIVDLPASLPDDRRDRTRIEVVP